MKKLILLCMSALFSTAIFASGLDPVLGDASAKILQVFHRNFPEVSNHSISNLGNLYMVYFHSDENNSSCRMYYDSDGNVLETVRYYTGEQLPPFIRAKIESAYKGKSIFMVTEVANENDHHYQVILRDAESMLVVDVKDNGSMHLQKKYKRAV